MVLIWVRLQVNMLHHRLRAAGGPPGRLEFIGSSFDEYDDEVAIPTHQAGDLLVILAQSGSTVVVPPGWTAVGTATYGKAGYRVATAAGTLSGDWGSSSSKLACFVWRGSTGITSVGAVGSRYADDPDLIIPAVTCQSYKSWIVSMAAAEGSPFSIDGAPTNLPGMTLRFNNSSWRRAWDSNGPKSALSQQTITTSPDTFLSVSMEVKV